MTDKEKIQKLIDSISIIRGNLSYIESKGVINGTLHGEISRVIKEFHEYKMNDDNTILTFGDIESLGWGFSSGVGSNRIYIHKNWNLLNDEFYISMNVFGENIEIVENNNRGEYVKFSGNIKTKGDLVKVMDLLDFEF